MAEKGRTRRRRRKGRQCIGSWWGKEAVVVVVWQWWSVYVISACAACPLPPSPGPSRSVPRKRSGVWRRGVHDDRPSNTMSLSLNRNKSRTDNL